MNDLIGCELGSYRILEQIGIGGMATVYKAYHPATDRYVAVKVLSEQMSQGGELRKRFQRETRVIAGLEHAHILPVYDSGEAHNQLYLVMRYVEVGTLKERIDQGPLALGEVNRIFQQVGGALEYAHQRDVVHRDVKPSNVLIDAQGDCYLTDFGLARILESSIRLTASGVGVGTPAYMSPEQGKGETVDARSDIYALGVMLYEMVTGHVPYEAETPMAVVLKHISDPLPLPRSVNPDIPPEVERVILKALAKSPDDRFQAVGEMIAALAAAVRKASAEAPAQAVAGEPAIAQETRPQTKGLLARAAAGLQRAARTGWGRAALWAAIGIVALLAFALVLSRVPLQVQIRGGQLQVLKVDQGSSIVEGVEGATQIGPTKEMQTSTPRPAAAAPGVDRSPEDVYIVTDDTWRFTRDPAPGWQQLDYDDSDWAPVEGEPCGEIGDTQPACLWDYPYRYVLDDTLYFRKVFDVVEVPPRARIVAVVDDDVDIYVNGALVLRDDNRRDGRSEGEVTGLVRPGANVLALRAVDTGEGGALVQVALGLCFRTEDRHDPMVSFMDHKEGWFEGDVSIEAVDAPCDSGVVEIAYQVDGGPWQAVEPGEVFRLPDGEHDVRARAVDSAGRRGFDSWHFLVGSLPDAAAAEVSPLGKIVYASDTTVNGDIYVASSDGSDERKLIAHPADDRYPAWSPDGERIVFSSDRDAVAEGSRQLYIVNADGSNLVRLTDTERTDKHPSWSPDGRRIAFHSWCSLIVIDADGTSRTTVVEAREDLCASFPTWSPDGQQIAFRSTLGPDQGGPYQHDIYVVNADGSKLLKLATFQSGETGDLTSEQVGGHVVWSPDGDRVAFGVWLEGQRGYYTVESDGSGELQELSEVPQSWYPWYWPQWAAAPTLAPADTPVTVSVQGDAYCHVYGPAGDLASRNLWTGFDVHVQSRQAAQVVVESPGGERVVLLPYGDIYGWERRFSGSVQELPQAGTYTFTVLDADGEPIPGAVDTDVYLGGYEPHPPVNVQAEVVEGGILVTWEPSPVLPGAFDPLGKPTIGWYSVLLYREGGELVYGWENEHWLLSQPSCVIPYRRQDFGFGDTGRALEELEDGNYTLQLHAFSVAPEGTDGYYVECIAFDPAEVVRIVIEGGQVRVEGLSPTLAPTSLPSLSGRVTDAATGQGIAEAVVEASQAGQHRYDYSVTTDSDGRYSMYSLPGGDYIVRVIARGYAREYYDNVAPAHEAELIGVSAGSETSGIDFILNEGGSISGHVYQGDGVTPIAGAGVQVRPSKYRFDPGFWAETDAGGAYSVGNLPLGTFKVTAVAEGYVQFVNFYGGLHGWDKALDVAVTPPDNTPGIDVNLDRAGSISGHVYESDGVTPIPNVVLIADCVTEEFPEGFAERSDSEGHYLIGGILPGSYTVRIGRDSPKGYAGEYYDSKATCGTADLVVVRAGENTPGIDFTLDEGGVITGRVFDDLTGDPLEDIELSACLPNGDCCTTPIAGTLYDGSYRFDLKPGEYFIQTGAASFSVLGHSYVPEWYENAYDIGDAALLRVAVHQEITGIDLHLARSGSISGHVYGENGDPIGNASVYAFSDVYPGNGANTGADGSYRIEGLLSGEYVLQVTMSGYVSEYYADVTDPALATKVNVNAPDDTPGVDLMLNRVSG